MFHPASAYLGQAGLAGDPPGDTLERLAGFATRILSVSAVFVSLVEEDTSFSAGCAAGAWSARRSTPLNRSLCWHPVESGLPLLIEDAREHPLVLENPAVWHGEVGYAAFPIRGADGGVAGCFTAIDSAPRSWTTDDVEALSMLADLAARVLHGGGRAEPAVEVPAPTRRPRGVSARMLQKAVDTMQIGVTITDVDGRILYVNPSDARMHGYAPAELMGHDVRIFAPPGTARPLDPQEVGAVTSWSRESVNARRDGSTFPVLLRSDVVHDADGRPVGLVTSCEDLTHRKELERELVRSTYYHAVTGLPNRDLLLHRLGIAVDRARREGVGFAVLTVGLERYQMVHDTLGRSAGDALLVEAGRRFSACMDQGGAVAHLAGGEFAVVVEGTRGAREPVRVAACIQGALASPFTLESGEVFSGAAIGIALGGPAYARADDVLRDAAVAMVSARASAMPYAVFDDQMHAEVRDRLQLETDLRHALARGELRVAYQPIVRLDTGRIAAFEALVRWAHPTRGLLQPDDFIPLAEETGLVVELGYQVLVEACRAAAAWREAPEGRDVAIAVNLSARQFSDPALVSRIGDVLAETGLPAVALELEITESVVMQHTASVSDTLRSLKALGVRLNVDDFGTGYSSLAYLHRLPVDVLKIDRSFVTQEIPGGLQLVRTIVALAHALGMAVVTEGVETPGLLRELRGIGCEYAQGFLFSEPVDSGAAGTLLAARPAW
jgi:PAS domain S-box-containing protein/diguanylate cyclase (GGDEF)-like protein